MSEATRQLAAIMFTDIVGYTALMGRDEQKAMQLLEQNRDLQKPLIEEYRGKYLKEIGDGILASFSSAGDAISCALAIQNALSDDQELNLRIGIHSGDITFKDEDVFGDGVNIASRIQSIADPGGIYISESIHKAIRGRGDIQTKYLGETHLKNVDYPVKTYALQGVGLPIPEIKDENELSGRFWAELQRRGISRAGTTYLMVSIILFLLLPYGESFLPDWAASALIIALVIGFPLAMYMAWSFERSPEGFVRTTSQQSWQNPLKASQRKPLISNVIIVGLVLVIFVMYAYPRYFSKETSTEGTTTNKSIAVLPLDIIGGDPEGEYFAAGVREEILNHLSLLEDLHVKSRSVVDRLSERTTTTQELVSELQLTHYLEGSARKVGDQVRITVQLIDAQTNNHIWSENYDSNYENIWDTQSEIAKKIAEELRVTISPEVARVIDKKPTDNPQAWDDYLRAMYYWRRYTSLRKPIELENMVRFLKASISKDPSFALAYTFLALAYGQSPGDPAIVFEFINPDSVLILCNRAIDLDPSLSDPYVIRADYFAYTTLDTVAAIRDYNQAISNGPHLPLPYWRFGVFQNVYRWDVGSALKLTFQGVQLQPEPWLLSQMLWWISWYYLEIADYQKAEYFVDKALIYDPDNISILQWKAHLYRVMGQYDKCLSVAQRIMEISPLNIGLYEMGMYYLIVKEYEESAKYFDEYFTKASETADFSDFQNNHMYGYALLKMGRAKEADDKFEIALNVLRERGHPTLDYEYAKIYSAKGMIDSAYYHLEKAVAGPIHWGMSDFMERDPLFENIKDEPEFQRLVGIAREKVRLKREEVRKLEESGEIPINLDEIELY